MDAKGTGSMEFALKAEGVRRKYGRQEVLRDFSLSVEPGGFDALMGPSGSGKSTFLHIAAGLLAADAGSVLVGGRDVARMSDAEATKFRRRHVGVVFQSFNLLNEPPDDSPDGEGCRRFRLRDRFR